MAGIGDNKPPVLIELTPEQATFLVENCDSNLAAGLAFLQSVSRQTAEKLVAQMEMFKAIKKAMIKGLDQ